MLRYKWPLALDLIKRGYEAGRQKKLLALFTEYFEESGPTVELTILGGTGYATKDPENAEALLSTNFDSTLLKRGSVPAVLHMCDVTNPGVALEFHLGSRNLAMKALLGEGIFTQDGSPWKHSRELLRRQFVRVQYQDLEGFRDHVERMIEALGQSPGVIDLQPYFFRLTLDITIATILGRPVENFRHEIADQFSRSFDEASRITATRGRLGDLYWLYTPKGFVGACKAVKTYIAEFIKDSIQQDCDTVETSDRYRFITDLYSEYQNTRLVRDQVINVILAGRDTTAATMSYVLWVNPASIANVWTDGTSTAAFW